MGKKLLVFVGCLCFSLALGGCGDEIQSLTTEQMEEIGNYSAGILLKYDANSRSRLVSDLEIQKYDERQARLEEIRKREEERKNQQQEQANEESANDNVGVGESAEVNYNQLTDFYVLPDGVTITYAGFTVQNAYPEAGEDIYPVTASDGKRLLVLNFQLDNHSGQDTFLDFFGLKASYKITINNKYTKGIFTTILLDDLATYIGNLPAGASERAVLLTEMDSNQLENVDSIVLKIKTVSNEYTIKLN